MSVYSVAIDVPLRRSFDYLPPAGEAGVALAPGCRVQVSFGRRKQVGLVLAHKSHSDIPAARLRPIEAVLDSEPLLSESHMTLLTWAAAYYRHPVGEVIAAAIPKALRAGKAARIKAAQRWRTTTGIDADALKRAPRQQALLKLLASKGSGFEESELDLLFERWRPLMKKLLERELVTVIEVDPVAARPQLVPSEVVTPTLTDEQAHVCDVVGGKLDEFSAFLLDGVTGSGKTEVYLQLTHKVLESGRQVLVLIPEIALAGQTLSRFAQRFHQHGIAVLHSGLNDGERLRAWLGLRDGSLSLAIGTRSAIWAQMARPGLIIVDEEHDLSFKQQEGFRYSARDVAVVRAQRLGIPVLLGSATPSLESLHNIQISRYTGLRLSKRPSAKMPRVKLVDIRDQPLQEGLSLQALDAIGEHLADARQVLVFMNRRGFAPAVVCLACNQPYQCPRCDARFVFHRSENRLRCHHCGSERSFPCPCPDCEAEDIYLVGQGTQRLEALLNEKFPETSILRIDRDATRRKGELERHLELARSGQAQLLVGTQMMSKGHDFSGLSLVVIVDTDGRLYGADFRAGERLAQLLHQVAGRSGRAEHTGTVLIQTAFPEHPVLLSSAQGSYHAFAEIAIKERREAHLPPFSAMALVRAQAKQRSAVNDFLQAARQSSENLDITGLELLGPAPAPMERLAGDYRGQLMLIGADRTVLGRFLDVWLPTVEQSDSARRVRWSIDIDPQEIL